LKTLHENEIVTSSVQHQESIQKREVEDMICAAAISLEKSHFPFKYVVDIHGEIKILV
jgi:hypothetical protein